MGRQITGQQALDYIKANGLNNAKVIGNSIDMNTINQLTQQGQMEKEKERDGAEQRRINNERNDRGFLGNLLFDVGSNLTALPRSQLVGVNDIANKVAKSINPAFAGAADQLSNNINDALLTSEEKRQLRKEGGAALLGRGALKTGGSLLSFVPGVGQTIPAAIAAGALSGAGNTENISDTGKLAQDALTGGAFSGLTAGALKGAESLLGGAGDDIAKTAVNEGGEDLAKLATNNVDEVTQPGLLGKAANKVNKIAENQENGAFQRTIGTKIKDQSVLPEFKRLGFTAAKDADELAEKASQVLEQGGNKLRQGIQQADGTVTYDEVAKPLIDKLNSKVGLASDKAQIQNVLDDIKSAFDSNDGTLSPQQLYELKQALGAKSKFDTTVSNISRDAYKDAYFGSNDILDNILKQNGFENFRALNKDINTALNASEYAQKAGSKAMASRPINLLDAVTAAGGLAGGGPLGFAGGAVASKALQSPAAENLVVGGLKKAAGGLNTLDKFIQGGSNMIPGLPSLAIGNGNKIATGTIDTLRRQLDQDDQRKQFERRNMPLNAENVAQSAPVDNGMGIDQPIEPQAQTQGQPQNNKAIQNIQKLVALGFKPDAKMVLDALNGGETEQKAAKPLSSEEKKLKSYTKSGLKSVDDLESFLSKDKGLLFQANLPDFAKSPKAKQFQAAIDNAADAFGRLRSGGAINAEESAKFKQLLPTTFDDEETINYKINQIKNTFKDIADQYL